MSLIEFRNVYFTYTGRNYILEGVNLSMPERGIVCVVTEPGNGKSTFLKLIKGILLPTRGKVITLDIDTSRADKEKMMQLHTKISIHFQDVFLISNIDIYTNLALPLLYNTNLSQKEIEYEVDKTLDLFDLKTLKYEMPFNLSLTEAKLVSISRAFMRSPRIILLDEPFSFLDSYYKARLIEIMEENKTTSEIIFTTSDEIYTQNSEFVLYILNEGISNKVCLLDKKTGEEKCFTSRS
ncbi:MAG: ATP-binding cassette domain-containing protein [Brevinematia bacterium]